MSFIRKTRNVIFFDSETLSLNSHEPDIEDNPYNFDAKLLTTQVLANGVMTIEKEWEIGEKKLLENFLFRFDGWANTFKNRRYMPIVTYNGLFDIFYILGRMNELNFPKIEINKLEKIFLQSKNIDLIQYDKGYYISLDAICNKYKIGSDCKFNGSDIKRLYHEKKYDDIIAHGKDDVNRLYRLVTETSLSDRFFVDDMGVFK